jgi:hypothetical protein
MFSLVSSKFLAMRNITLYSVYVSFIKALSRWLLRLPKAQGKRKKHPPGYLKKLMQDVLNSVKIRLRKPLSKHPPTSEDARSYGHKRLWAIDV